MVISAGGRGLSGRYYMLLYYLAGLLEKAEKCPEIEPYLIQKIKKDFEVKEAVENHLEICIEGDNCDNE